MEESVLITEGSKITITLPREVVEQARADTEEWFESYASESIAKIAEAPEFVKVAALEGRRAKAEATSKAMSARIAEIKAACSEKIVDNPAAVDKAAEEIEQCERTIKAAKLAVDTVDSLLPDATQARYMANKKGLQVTVGQLIKKSHEERRAAMAAFVDAVQAHGRTLLDLNARPERLSKLGHMPEEYVLGCAARRGGD